MSSCGAGGSCQGHCRAMAPSLVLDTWFPIWSQHSLGLGLPFCSEGIVANLSGTGVAKRGV